MERAEFPVQRNRTCGFASVTCAVRSGGARRCARATTARVFGDAVAPDALVPEALDDLAVGAGFGLRFDPQVIVVRLDLATPLRDPAFQ